MKKRRALLLTLLALLLVVGIPSVLMLREYRREQASRDLIAAIYANDTEKVLAALKQGADPNARDHSDDKPLSFGEHVKRLFKNILRPNVKTNPDQHLTALLVAILTERQHGRGKGGNPALVNALLDAGADPNLTGEDYEVSPLMWAAFFGKDPTSLRLLLQHGANLQQKDQNGGTALHWAAINSTSEAAAVLLVAGADINGKDNDGWTPLHKACGRDKMETVQMLLQHHANPNIRDNRVHTPLDEAMRRNADKDAPIIQLLRKAGAKTGKELSSQ